MSSLGFGRQRLIQEIIKQTWHVDNPSSIKFTLKDIMFLVQEMLEDEGKRYLLGNQKKEDSFGDFKY